MKDKRAWKQALFWVSIRNTRKVVNKQTIEPVCLHKKSETNCFTEKVPAVGLEPTRGCPQQILSYLLHTEYKRTQPPMEVVDGHQKAPNY